MSIVSSRKKYNLDLEIDRTSKKNQLDSKFQSLFERAPIAISVAQNGIHQYVNPAYVKLFGYNNESELTEKPIYDQISSEQRTKIAAMSSKREKGGYVPTTYETYGIKKDGTRIPLYIEVSKIDLSDGVASVAYIIDLTQIKKTEDRLKESELRFQMMADSAPVMIWMTHADQTSYYFNKGWLDFTGRTIDKELGNGWITGLHPDDKEQAIEICSTSFHKRKEFKMEFRLKRADGEYRWILDHGIPRFASDGAFMGYIGSCIDITERKETEKRKDEFISMASHELKTPVTSIKVFNQLLQQQSHNLSSQKAQQLLTKMDLQLIKLTDLINDLLDLSKLQSGKLVFQKDYFNLTDLIKEIIEIYGPTTKHTITFSGKVNNLVYGDRERISQVIINLLTNAIKYSPKADKIHIHMTQKKSEITVSIEDFGIGISKENLGKIFDRFFRVSGPRELTFPGLGIGLYIASEIIKRHNGKIWATSKIHKGSTFFFSLPTRNYEK